MTKEFCFRKQEFICFTQPSLMASLRDIEEINRM